MEIIATLEKPFTPNERESFILVYNHRLGYIIEDRDECIVALGYTQEEEEEREKERISKLSVTKSDFFDATIKAFNLDDSDLLPIVSNIISQVEVPETMKKIAMNNFRNAKDFYRNHEIFNVIANNPIVVSEELTIVLTPEQLDKYFDRASKHDSEAYKELLPIEEGNSDGFDKFSESIIDEGNSNNDL